MVTKQHVMDLVNHRVTHILLVAEASLPPSQYQAFRKVVLWMRLGGMGCPCFTQDTAAIRLR